jgi:hypothetical protein
MEAVDESLQHKEQSLHELPATEPVEAPAVRRRRHVHRTVSTLGLSRSWRFSWS